MPIRPPVEADVRIVYTYDNGFAGHYTITGNQLDDLRCVTGTRFIYAHTEPHIAGAVTQTNLLDYQDDKDVRGDRPSHVGAPLSCLEIKVLAEKGLEDVDDDDLRGRPLVGGPVVVGGDRELDEVLRITDRRVFAYV